MAEIIFDPDVHGHRCSNELAEIEQAGTPPPGTIARCSCGTMYCWVATQRDSYWSAIADDSAALDLIVRSGGGTITRDAARTILWGDLDD